MQGMKAYGRYGSLGLELVLSIVLGYWGGSWLDQKLGTQFLGFIGFLVGCYAGFRSLFVAGKRMQRDIEKEERLARGEDPWAPPAPEDEPKDDDEPSYKS